MKTTGVSICFLCWVVELFEFQDPRENNNPSAIYQHSAGLSPMSGVSRCIQVTPGAQIEFNAQRCSAPLNSAGSAAIEALPTLPLW